MGSSEVVAGSVHYSFAHTCRRIPTRTRSGHALSLERRATPTKRRLGQCVRRSARHDASRGSGPGSEARAGPSRLCCSEGVFQLACGGPVVCRPDKGLQASMWIPTCMLAPMLACRLLSRCKDLQYCPAFLSWRMCALLLQCCFLSGHALLLEVTQERNGSITVVIEPFSLVLGLLLSNYNILFRNVIHNNGFITTNYIPE
jgi:hypothetical protein